MASLVSVYILRHGSLEVFVIHLTLNSSLPTPSILINPLPFSSTTLKVQQISELTLLCTQELSCLAATNNILLQRSISLY